MLLPRSHRRHTMESDFSGEYILDQRASEGWRFFRMMYFDDQVPNRIRLRGGSPHWTISATGSSVGN